MRIKINSVNVDWIAKGKTKYGKATVAYSYNGEPRTQTIVSFANPSIFKQVTEGGLEGQEAEVETTKNAQNFTEWVSITTEGASTTTPDKGVPTTRVAGSNYETAEERAKKQVYIIKQSSISAAVNILTAQQVTVTVDAVKEVAQDLTDWVLGNPTE